MPLVVCWGAVLMFLKVKRTHTNRQSRCNARMCECKPIPPGTPVVHTVSTYKGRVLSRVWRPECFERATGYAPYYHRLKAIREGKEVLALPLAAYCPETGRVLGQQ